MRLWAYSPWPPAGEQIRPKKQPPQSPAEALEGVCSLLVGVNKSLSVILSFKCLVFRSSSQKESMSTPCLLHSCFNLFDDLYHRFGGRKKRTVILIPETPGAGVPICAQLVVLLTFLLAGLQVVQTQRVDARVLGAGRRGAMVHFGAFNLINR